MFSDEDSCSEVSGSDDEGKENDEVVASSEEEGEEEELDLSQLCSSEDDDSDEVSLIVEFCSLECITYSVWYYYYNFYVIWITVIGTWKSTYLLNLIPMQSSFPMQESVLDSLILFTSAFWSSSLSVFPFPHNFCFSNIHLLGYD